MRSLHIALRVIELVGDLQPVGVSELARRLDFPKSTVQRSLKSLAEEGWIEAISSDKTEWSLTLRAGLAVGRADYAVSHLRLAAFPIMEELRQSTRESVYLAVRSNYRMALIERMDGLNPVVHAWPLWQPGPLHATSLGKSILAAMPEEESEVYLAKRLFKTGPHTETRPEKLRQELQEIRSKGYATAFQTNWPNENGVGAVIRDHRGSPAAAISISAPIERISEADCIALSEPVMNAARRISLGLSRR